ncbi:hypothetical protein B0J14DRAFT_559797 [Halenospora varia]|nr:hypothetical protein B0J14DRAFT_559797 [Halenospora varia]
MQLQTLIVTLLATLSAAAHSQDCNTSTPLSIFRAAQTSPAERHYSATPTDLLNMTVFEESLRNNAERCQHMPVNTVEVAYIRHLLRIFTLRPRNATQVRENIVVTGGT